MLSYKHHIYILMADNYNKTLLYAQTISITIYNTLIVTPIVDVIWSCLQMIDI